MWASAVSYSGLVYLVRSYNFPTVIMLLFLLIKILFLLGEFQLTGKAAKTAKFYVFQFRSF